METQDILTIVSLAVAFGSVVSTTILGWKNANLQKDLKDVEIQHDEKIQNLRCNHEREIEEIKSNKAISLKLFEKKIDVFSQFNEAIISLFNPDEYKEEVIKLKEFRSLVFKLRMYIPEKSLQLIGIVDLIANLGRINEEYKEDWYNPERNKEVECVRRVISEKGEKICRYLPQKLT